WVSTMPGMRMPPEASTTTASSGARSSAPTRSIRSPRTSTSPRSSRPIAGSMDSTVASRNRMGRPVVKSSGRGSLIVMRSPRKGLEDEVVLDVQIGLLGRAPVGALAGWPLGEVHYQLVPGAEDDIAVQVRRASPEQMGGQLVVAGVVDEE